MCLSCPDVSCFFECPYWKARVFLTSATFYMQKTWICAEEFISMPGPFTILMLSSITTRKKQKARSEEHTSELQSRENLVCRLLLEKKNTEITFKSHNI